MAQKYDVHGYPTILFIDETGKVESKIVGYQTAIPFAEHLDLIAQAHRGLAPLQKRLKADPHDVEAAATLAAVLALQGKMQESEELVTQAEQTDPDNKQDHLTLAYNELGDYYQDKNDFDKAMSYFQKAAKTGKTPSDVAYAHLSLAQCDMSQKKSDAAIEELKTAAALPDLPQDDKDMVEMMLKALQKQGGG